jgi:hypothetical protein
LLRTVCVREEKSLATLAPVLPEVAKKGNCVLGEEEGGDLTRSSLLPTMRISAFSLELSLISLSQESMVSKLLGSWRS